jgi:hypothetical protein
VRAVTRNALLAIVATVAVLLALGAAPSFLRSGDPYYLTATPVEDRTALNASTLSERRYPYTTGALADADASTPGRSEPYWRGPVGAKEAFSHSPFDEMSALGQLDAASDPDDGDVYVRHRDTVYRLEVKRGE